MPTAFLETLPQPAPPAPPRKKWTRLECDSLERSGLLETEHLELIEGDLISKTPKYRPHVNNLWSLVLWLIKVFGPEFVNQEAPIDVAPEDNPTNLPEPDAIVLKREYSLFRSNPQPEDLRLVVEVSDTTLNFDLTVKAALYARAGIVEYWVLDVNGRRLIVHRDPASRGYESIVAYAEHESISPLAAPKVEFRVADAFTSAS